MFQLMSPALSPTLSDDDLLCDAGDLGLMTRRVLELRIPTPERHRFIRDDSARPPPATRC
jgi:hypothetical protein